MKCNSMIPFLSLQCIIILLASKSCHSFTVSHKTIINQRTVVTPLFQSAEQDGSNDTSDNASTSPHLRAIEEAMEATRKFGATSKEARVAWEIAEEIEDSIFSPCSKRCDPLPRSATSSEDVKNDIPPLFVDKSTLGDENEGD